jgi:hypothetical protein
MHKFHASSQLAAIHSFRLIIAKFQAGTHTSLYPMEKERSALQLQVSKVNVVSHVLKISGLMHVYTAFCLNTVFPRKIGRWAVTI